MNSTKQIRQDIMELIFKIDDISILKSIHYKIKKEDNSSVKKEDLNFMEAVKPIQKDVSLEEIMHEQSYKPISYEMFRKKIDTDQVEWKESLEELLAAIK